jgi:hypothetical protein
LNYDLGFRVVLRVLTCATFPHAMRGDVEARIAPPALCVKYKNVPILLIAQSWQNNHGNADKQTIDYKRNIAPNVAKNHRVVKKCCV